MENLTADILLGSKASFSIPTYDQWWVVQYGELDSWYLFLFLAPHKFYIGFRYADPLTEETIDQMEKYVVRHISWSQRFSFAMKSEERRERREERGERREGRGERREETSLKVLLLTVASQPSPVPPKETTWGNPRASLTIFLSLKVLLFSAFSLGLSEIRQKTQRCRKNA